jgi:hypothetical protein
MNAADSPLLYEQPETAGLDICVDHGVYLGYSYLNTIFGLRSVNRYYRNLIDQNHNTIAKILEKEAQESLDTKHTFNIKTFVFNKYNTACGWTYYYCDACKLPERKPCGWMYCWHTECTSSKRCTCKTPAIKVTLFRFQFAGKTEASTDNNTVTFAPNIKKYVINSEVLGAKLTWADNSSYTLKNSYKDNLLDIAPWFDTQDNLCIYKNYLNSNSAFIAESYINNKGEYYIGDLACTLDRETIDLSSFVCLPGFFDTIISNNVYKKRTDDGITFDADAILSCTYNFNQEQLHLLNLLLKRKGPTNLFMLYLMRIGYYSSRDQKAVLDIYKYSLTKSKKCGGAYVNVKTNPLGWLEYNGKYIRENDICLDTLLERNFTWEGCKSVMKELKVCKKKSKIILPPNHEFSGSFFPSFLAEVRKKPYEPVLLHIWTGFDKENKHVPSYNFAHINQLTEKTYIDLWKQSVNIIVGSTLYCLKKDGKIDTTSEIPVLTDQDTKKGYIIDKVEPINQEKGTIAAYLKPKKVWDYMYLPYKHIDLSTGVNTFARDGFNFKLLSYDYLMKSFSIVTSLLYNWQTRIERIKYTILDLFNGRR